jgi:protease-4
MSEFDSSAAAPQPPPRPAAIPAHVTVTTNKRSGFGLGFFAGCLGLAGVLVLFMIALAMLAGEGAGREAFPIGDRVAVLEIEGEIIDSRDTIENLHDYADAHGVRAIIVRINSPGGAVAPSQEIFSEILKVRKESGKPIVASMNSVAASGGYYIAAACDSIVANPGTITGSIGVISQWFNMEELVRWAKMKPETLTSGRMKDAGSPFRAISPEEREYLQRVVTQLHEQFVSAVAEGRHGKLTRDEVRKLADGRIYTGEEAKRLKLVDEIGNFDRAVEVAAGLAGMKGTPKVLYPRRKDPTLLEIFSSMRQTPEQMIRGVAQREGSPFLYRW